jgi:hypothetical protein
MLQKREQAPKCGSNEKEKKITTTNQWNSSIEAKENEQDICD